MRFQASVRVEHWREDGRREAPPIARHSDTEPWRDVRRTGETLATTPERFVRPPAAGCREAAAPVPQDHTARAARNQPPPKDGRQTPPRAACRHSILFRRER